jgi:hypothetical protein
MIRTALASGCTDVVERLLTEFEPRYPLEEHALGAVRAQLAEHAGDHALAAAVYAEAADRWAGFGNVHERAYALLGQGRCLVTLGEPGAEHPLRVAHKLFESMGYQPALSETDALLERAAAPTP